MFLGKRLFTRLQLAKLELISGEIDSKWVAVVASRMSVDLPGMWVKYEVIEGLTLGAQS